MSKPAFTEFEMALINRDALSTKEAEEQRRQAREKFYEMMDECASYDDVEEMMMCDYGLEMDYIFDIM